MWHIDIDISIYIDTDILMLILMVVKWIVGT